MTRGVAARARRALRSSRRPQVALRGHQLGYRPKTNAYDAWDVPMWEQYIRDLAIFGSNAIELIPPRIGRCGRQPALPAAADRHDGRDVAHRRRVRAGRLDLVPRARQGLRRSEAGRVRAQGVGGGVLEAAAHRRDLRARRRSRAHAAEAPDGAAREADGQPAQVSIRRRRCGSRRRASPRPGWTSSTGSSKTEPAWLTGVVFGPQVRDSLPVLRAKTPKRYRIRHYPDITHSLRSQYPVQDWDVAHALTSQREQINPRPVDEAVIFRSLMPYVTDFITYSEGRNDDVNKFVWSGLGWDPKADVAADPARVQPLLHRRPLHRFVRAGAARARAELARSARRRTRRSTPRSSSSRRWSARPRRATCSTGASSRRSTAPTTTPTCAAGCSTRRRSRSARSSGCAPRRPASRAQALADARAHPRRGAGEARRRSGVCASTRSRRRCSRASGSSSASRATARSRSAAARRSTASRRR